MSFMHFEAHTAAAGEASVSLSGTSGSPNISFGQRGTDDATQTVTASAGWIFGTNNVPGLTETGSITRSFTTGIFNPTSFVFFNRAKEWINDKDFLNDYWIRATLNSGSAPTSGSSLNTWHALVNGGSQPSWTWACTSKIMCSISGSLQIEIARDDIGSPGTVLATGYYGATAQVET